jgi:Acetyltransferase (GNAT) domain
MVAATGLLAIQLRTLFLLTDTGRIERENEPGGHLPGPRLWFAGCASGNVISVRSDIASGVATQIAILAAAEPPFTDPNRPPKYLDRYIDLLSRDGVAPQKSLGLIYEFPHHLQYRSRVGLIDDESHEVRRVHELLSADGMPDGLAELGFRSVSDLWRPWCAALVDGQVASIAFAARISTTGAELGVATVKAFRGQGYAAAAVAGWSRLPVLRWRELFYSPDGTNVASQRVIARLGLRFLGASLRLS